MNNKNMGILLVASLGLSGCGLFGDTFRDRSNDYQLAEEMPVLKVPTGMSNESLGEIYTIPAIPDDTVVPGEFETPRPERTSETAFEQSVKIQTLGDSQWALVQASPSEVWPKVRNALTRNALPTARTDATAGEMDTVWVTFENDEEFAHRFRLKIEPGVQFNTTEVSVLHNQVAKGQESSTAEWVSESGDPQREKDILKLVAETLAGDVSNTTVSLLAQAIGGEAKVDMVTPKDGVPHILIKLGYERSWASVVYSSERGGFSIIDQDQTAGIIYAQYNEDGEDSGWFSGWFGGDKDERRVDYHIKLNKSEQGVEVFIENADGSAMEYNEAVSLLKVLRSNLS